jgi:hypothetical protein
MKQTKCKDCMKKQIIIDMLKGNLFDCTSFLDKIADKYPETDSEITTFLDDSAERIQNFSLAVKTQIITDKSFRRRYGY